MGPDRFLLAGLYDVRRQALVREARVPLGDGLPQRLDALSSFLLTGEASGELTPLYPPPPDPPKSQPPEDPAAFAKIHYNKGRELFTKGNYREAIKEFELAVEAKPHPFTYFNLAECYERLGDARARLRNLRAYLRMLPNAEDRASVLRVMTDLEAKLRRAEGQVLTVESQPAEAEVWIDAEVRGRTPFRADMYLGNYEVTVLKPGYEPVTQRVELERDRPVHLELTLKGSSTPAQSAAVALAMSQKANPASVPDLAVAPPSRIVASQPAPPLQRKRLWTWVAGGACAASTAVGILMGTLAKKKSDEMLNGVHKQTDVQRLHDQAQSYQRNANIFYGLAGAAGAAGVTLFFVEGRF